MSQLVKVHSNLERLLTTKAAALPQGFNQTRWLQNSMVVLQDVKGIENMDPVSVARTMLKGAFLGLDFFNRECYAIPYGNKVQFQTDYKGEVKLAKLYSTRKIADIYAKLVRVGDEFEEMITHGQPVITFRPKPFNNADIVGVFAICLYADGTMIYETMSIEEVEKIRKRYSKQSDRGPWVDSYGEMVKKTCLRRLTKHIELDFRDSDQQQAYEEGGGVQFKKVEREPIQDPEPVAIEAEVVVEEPSESASERKATPVQIATLTKKLRDLKGQIDPSDAAKLEAFLEQDAKSYSLAAEWMDYFVANKML